MTPRTLNATLRVSSLTRRFDGRAVLDRLDFDLADGQFVALLGKSGSGKTTLLRILTGLDTADEGEVGVSPRTVSVFQEPRLIPNKRVIDNLLIGLPKTPANRDRARAALGDVGLEDRARAWPALLSGGEQQRVALARAFVARPRILFADEPTGSLDQATGQQISDLLFALNATSDTTLVLVTHDLRLAQRCERIYRLDGGRLVDAAGITA